MWGHDVTLRSVGKRIWCVNVREPLVFRESGISEKSEVKRISAEVINIMEWGMLQKAS